MKKSDKEDLEELIKKIKRNKSTIGPLVVVAILIAWLLNAAIIHSYAWYHEINDRIDIEISKTGLNFNRNQSSYNEYRFDLKPIECKDERDWQVVNNTLQQTFEFMKSNLPPRSILYKYEEGFHVYIGYTYDSLIGPVFIGYHIYTDTKD